MLHGEKDQAADKMVDMEAPLPPQLTGIHITSIAEVCLHVIISVNTSIVYVQSPQAVLEEQEEGESEVEVKDSKKKKTKDKKARWIKILIIIFWEAWKGVALHQVTVTMVCMRVLFCVRVLFGIYVHLKIKDKVFRVCKTITFPSPIE